jgi:hypothetical protein
MKKITISPLNKMTHTRELKLTETAIEDIFFLRLRPNNSKHLPLTNVTLSKELVEFNQGHSHSTTFLTIPFSVSEEGNYWCVGTDYITRLPIFTERVLVEIPHEEFQRYLVLVETPRKYDPILYCQKFGAITARNLNISNANIALKRITSSEHLHLLLYHVTLMKNHTNLVGATPIEFKFYVENTNHGLARITSIRRFSSRCPPTTLNSYNNFSVNLKSTMKGNNRSHLQY